MAVWRRIVRRAAVAAAASSVAALVITSAAGAAPPHDGHGLHQAHHEPHGPSAVVDVQSTPAYGTILVATLMGQKFPLYLITSDHPPFFGCGTTPEATFQGTIACTGRLTFTAATTGPEWPALTTTGPVVGGPGVVPGLLGTVYRPGIGRQVTYGGHPLYLFSTPTTFFGEGFLETVQPLPPWHGLWDLVSAGTGTPATGQATLEPGSNPGGATVLSVEEYPYAAPGGAAITVYEFSCSATAPEGTNGRGHPRPPSCGGRTGDHGAAGAFDGVGDQHGQPTTTWIPVLTQGAPLGLAGVPAGSLGTVPTEQGTQVTFDGHPLYLYASEAAIFATSSGPPNTTGTEGNGAGLPGPAGTAQVIALG